MVPPNEAARPSKVAHGAAAGLGAGLVASLLGAGYMSEIARLLWDGPFPLLHTIPWGRVATVFVVLLALTGALMGGAITFAKNALDRRMGRRTRWAPAAAASLATAMVAAPAAAFGADYFGSLHAPYMGNAIVLAIPCTMAVALGAALAWLDRGEGERRGWRRLGASVLAAVALALPLLVAAWGFAALVPDTYVLQAFWTVPLAKLGALAGAALGVIFGLYAGGVMGALRKSEPAPAVEPRVRVEASPEKSPEKKDAPETTSVDPLAEDEAELLARFAELEARENARAR